MTNGEKLKEIFPYLESDLNIDELPSPTTDEEIAKSFIEDVEAVKDQLPCGQMMDFPKSFDDFVKDYGFKDKEKVYTNGSELISVFRVKQWLEHISTTKNDLGVSSELEKNSKKLEKNFGELDCISRAQIQTEIEMNASRYTIAKERGGMGQVEWSDQLIKVSDAVDIIRNLPSVTPRELKWIPVSERLPKAEYGESDSVLVCFENGTQDVLYFDGSNWRYPTGETYISVNHKNDWHNKVVAWMPKPQPYIEVEE